MLFSCKLNFIWHRKILLTVYEVFFYFCGGKFTAKDSEKRAIVCESAFIVAYNYCCTIAADLCGYCSTESDSIKVLNALAAIDSISKELNVYFMFNTRPHSRCTLNGSSYYRNNFCK